jgi:hypothetical protein
MQHEQGRGEDTDRRRLGGLLAGLIIAVPLVALLAFVAYCAALGGSAAWSTLGVGGGVAAAATAVGAFLGFLFGIPRSHQGNTAPKPDESYGPNTNLEEISDWLTKILVGVGLIELGRAGPPARNLIASVGAALGDTSAARVVAAVLLIVFVVWGFVASYLLTRLRAAGAFLASELSLVAQHAASVATGQVKKLLDEQAARDATALALLERTLNPAAGVSPPTQRELDKAIAAASPQVKTQAFLQACRQRKESWKRDEDKEKMERTLPVFMALIASDINKEYHRNHAQLGYALKDSREPRWSEAEKALSEAIERRDRSGDSGKWILYEFNHALCLIALEPSATSIDAVDAIKADLAIVARSKRAPGLLQIAAIQDWYDRNHISQTTVDPKVATSPRH